MDTIYLELLEKKEIRSNLSALRAKLREGVDAAYDRESVETFVQEHEAFVLGLVRNSFVKNTLFTGRGGYTV